MRSSISAANANTLFSIGELRASWVFSPGSVLFCAMRFLPGDGGCGYGSGGFQMVLVPEVDHVHKMSGAVRQSAGRVDRDSRLVQAVMDIGQRSQVIVALNQNRMLRPGEIPAQF